MVPPLGQHLPPVLCQPPGIGHRPWCIHSSLCICVSHINSAPLRPSPRLLHTSMGPTDQPSTHSQL